MTSKKSSSLPWYSEGLRFKCTECGKCCTGAPGYVWVTADEMQKIADLLNIPLDLFKRKYTRQSGNKYSLIEKKTHTNDNDCIFLKDKKCTIYQARPKQCRTFPWWKENLQSEESWKFAAKECEGINDESPIVPFDEIQKQLNINSQNSEKQ